MGLAWRRCLVAFMSPPCEALDAASPRLRVCSPGQQGLNPLLRLLRLLLSPGGIGALHLFSARLIGSTPDPETLPPPHPHRRSADATGTCGCQRALDHKQPRQVFVNQAEEEPGRSPVERRDRPSCGSHKLAGSSSC